MGLLVVLAAFGCEFVDSSLGMGYGTTLTPLLLLMGYQPLQVVPAVLVSEFVTGILAGLIHHRFGNVDFGRASPHLRIVRTLALCSVVGAVAAVAVAVSVQPAVIRLYVGLMVTSMGIGLLATRGRKLPFSWRRITGLGLIAAFNKGISGGGYGPLITAGQILNGVEGRNAVGITSLAEGLTCLVGVLMYLGVGSAGDWRLAGHLLLGAVLSVPLSGLAVRRMPEAGLRTAIGVATLALGVATLTRLGGGG